MKKTVRKVFFLWDYEKEERWLNEMSQKGWQLTWASFRKYRIEKGEPGQYEYKLELLEKKTAATESKSYLEFLKEAGIELVGECRNWIYLRSKTADKAFVSSKPCLDELSHLMKVQQFQNSLRNMLMLMVVFSFVLILALEEFTGIPVADFFRGFGTGLGLASSVIALCFVFLMKKQNRKMKEAIKELYTCE